MLNIIIAFVGGLVVGWNFLKQPEWAKSIVDRITDQF